MADEGEGLDLCSACGGGRLHPGDTVAIAPTDDPAVGRALRALARSRGLRVVLRSGPNVVTLDPLSAQQRIETVCESTPDLRTAAGIARAPSSPSVMDAPAMADASPPLRPGPPHRSLLHRPVDRDPLFWIAAGTALVGGVLASAGIDAVRAWIEQLAGFGSAADVVTRAMAGISTSDLRVLAVVLVWIAAWTLLAWTPALIRRPWRRRLDREALALPPVERMPGWYADPAGQASRRWWNGLSWTGAIRPQPRTGWAWPIGPVLTASIVLCVFGPTWVTASLPRLPGAVIAQPEAGRAPSAAQPAGPAPWVGDARYRSALAGLDSALLAYSRAAATEPVGQPAVAAFARLQASARRLAAVTVDQPGASDVRRTLTVALSAYLDARAAMIAEASACAAADRRSRTDGDACRADVVQRWQARLAETIDPLTSAYAAVASQASQK